jgi:hypothetical protein
MVGFPVHYHHESCYDRVARDLLGQDIGLAKGLGNMKSIRQIQHDGSPVANRKPRASNGE